MQGEVRTRDCELFGLCDEARQAKEVENKVESQLVPLWAEKDSAVAELADARKGFQSKQSRYNSDLLARKKELVSVHGELTTIQEQNLKLLDALRSIVARTAALQVIC